LLIGNRQSTISNYQPYPFIIANAEFFPVFLQKIWYNLEQSLLEGKHY